MAFAQKVSKDNVDNGEVINGMSEFMKKVDDTPVVKLETRVSRKNGNQYVCLVIYYRGYEKLVFLNQAEQFMFQDLR